jgi:hypothetical protein
LNDIYTGLKVGILGKGALLTGLPFLRFSSSLGLKIPIMSILEVNEEPDRTEKVQEPSQLLWGTALGLYLDLIPSDFFLVNFFVQGIYYPEQRSWNTAFDSESVNHPIDIIGEIEPRFSVPAGPVVLNISVPVRVQYAPIMNSNDEAATNQYCFSVGGHIGVYFPNIHTPVEIALAYNAPVKGQNADPVHKISLLFTVYAKARDSGK